MIEWFARNGVAANLLAAILIIGGLGTIIGIKVELFPQFSMDTISIRVVYRGAAPEEVEEQVIERIEEEIQDLQGIKEMTANAIEGVGMVVVEVERDYSARKLLDDIKARVDSINTFPEQAEKPIVEENLIRKTVLWLSIYGDASDRTLKELAEEVRDEILAIEGITQVGVTGIRDYEIAVEVTENTLREYGLTFQQVVDAVRAGSVDLPGGAIKSEGGEILVRTKGQAYVGRDFEEVVLITREDGTRLTVGDIATVNDGFVDTVLDSQFNGQPAIMLTVSEVGQQSPLDISEKVQAYIGEKQPQLPAGVKMKAWGDSSYYLWSRLNMLIQNGLIGLVLVLAVLTTFLRPSLAFWVTLGIPISFLGTFLIMPYIGLSVNLISLYGFILVLGIVVDDAIVVGESVFTHFQEGTPGVEASIKGAHAVAMPVTYAVLTTMVAFTPLLDIPGFLGKFLVAIPMVVIPTLLFSLVESKLILPYHLSLCHVGAGDRKLNAFQRYQRRASKMLEGWIDKYYRPVLKVALAYRYVTLAIFVSGLMIVAGLLKGGWIKIVHFPAVPSDYIQAYLTYPEGTPADVTRRGLEQLHAGLAEAIGESIEAGRENPVENVLMTLGQQVLGGGPGGEQATPNQPHRAEVTVELRKSEARPKQDSANALADRWRESTGSITGIKSLRFVSNAAGGQGEPVDIRIIAPTLVQLREIADSVKETLGRFDGIFDIRDTLADNQREIQLKIKPRGEMLGLTQVALGAQVRAAFFGAEAQRVQRGRDDVRVMVRYPRDERESIGNLENMRIRTPDGREVPFGEVAEATMGYGYAAINRVDRQRVANIFADADKENIDLEAVKRELKEELLPGIFREHPGARWSFEGEEREVADTVKSLSRSVFIAAIIMYMLLAVPFKSYLQPLIVMAVIPFSLIGAVLGHLIMVKPLSMLSFFGIIALAGVVVNDSLVLVDFINRKRREGMHVFEAVWVSGAARFRPILLTSLTTFCGLCPILFETSLQAQFLIPMAISLSFGVLFATFITLILVPVCYLLLEDVGLLFAHIMGRKVVGKADKELPVETTVD